jgi:outer membrane protein, heavy metal efflux system
MTGGAISRFLPLALAAALAIGCRTEEQRCIPPPFNPPSSSISPPAADHALAGDQRNADPDIRLASATQPVSPSDAPPAALPAPSPTEVIPAPPQQLNQPLPPLSLSLFDAVEMGLTQNPDLIALRYAQNASEGALGVAETYPFNPWVQIQVTPFQKSGDPLINAAPVNHYVLLMQQLQLAHQRQHRTDAAAATLNSVRWNYVQAELTNVAQTQRLYFMALFQRGIAELARANAELNNQLLAISERQLQGGTISGADVAILRLDNAQARRQAKLAEANYQTALLDLKRQLGLPAAAPLELSGRLADWRWQELSSNTAVWSKFVCLEMPVKADRAWLARTLASERPDVWAANADVDTARANLDLARANRIPDLQIGPYYQRNNDPVTYWGLRAQMDLPVLNSGLPMVRQRLAELTQRQAIWDQLLNRATLEAQAAIDRYDRALSIASDSETAVGEELPVELRKLEEQFKAGEVDVVRVVTARTSFFNARRAALDTLNELAQASANLVAATGLPPEAILAPADERNTNFR